MSTKAELESKVEELARKVELLEARLLIAESNKGITIVYPKAPVMPTSPWNPFWPQQVWWCSTGTSAAAKGTFTINAGLAS